MGVCSLLHHRDFKSQSHRGYRGAQRRSDVAVQRCSLQPSPCNFQPSCASSPRAPTIAPLPVRAQRRCAPYVVLLPCPSRLAPLSLLASRLAPHPLAPPPLPRCRYGRSAAVTLRCNVAPCNLPPVTFNPLAPHPLAPLPLPRCRYGRSAAAPPTSSYYPAPRASRPSRSLPRASRLIPSRPHHCPAAGTGAAPQ
jgi:hypothetical protein